MNRWPHLRAQLQDRAGSIASQTRFVPVITALLGAVAIAASFAFAPSHQIKPDFLDHWRQQIQERAQVDLFDDFSHGLDAWQGAEKSVATWSYDKSGLVTPGSLLLFEPSRRFSDYDVDALVQVQAKALGFAFRAVSDHSYQVAKLTIEGSGPMNSLAVVRYAVIADRPSRPVVTRYPLKFQTGTFYQVHLEVHGDTFLLYVQGKLIDYWSDSELPVGGIGLFCSPGERASVAWIRVSHNKDFEGRLCSWLSSMLADQK